MKAYVHQALAHAAGVRHWQLTAALTPPCTPRGLYGRELQAWLQCNLTVAAPMRLVAMVERLRGYLRGG